MKKFKDAEDFFKNITSEDFRNLNLEKALWYEKRSYMNFTTKISDFYKEAYKKDCIENYKCFTANDFEKFLVIK